MDEDLEEIYWEGLESRIPVKEMKSLREEYDSGWNDSDVKEKLKLIVENTQGLIDKRCLL